MFPNRYIRRSLLNTKRPSKMFSQDRKYFPFRFSRVLALLLLLTSPTRAISAQESCVKTANAFMKNPLAAATDTKFLANLVDCLTSLGANGVLRDLILKLPDLMEKVLPFVTKEKGLVLLAAYLAYRSYELYDRAMKLEVNYRKNQYDFKVLQEKIKIVLKFILGKVIPQLNENGDIASMQNNIEELRRKLGDLSTELRELTEAIHRDVTQGESHKRWSFGYAAGLTTACVGSILVASPMGVGFTCVPAAVFVASHMSLDNTLTKLDLLWDDTEKLRKELAKYLTHLELVKMNHEVPVLDIYIRSEGCDDAGRKPSTPCGFAYIEVNGKDYSPHLRGYNVVVVDGATGDVLKGRGFDTPWGSSKGDRLREYLNGITGNKIVLVAIQDEGSSHMTPAIDALKRLGATDPIKPGWRGSFAFAGYAGENKPLWITQKSATRGMGPSEISLKILLSD